MGLPTTWDSAYAANVAGLLRDLLEPMVDEHDSATKYRRFDREIPMTPDGHIDVHESARQALRDRGLPADESAIAAILAAVEESC